MIMNSISLLTIVGISLLSLSLIPSVLGANSDKLYQCNNDGSPAVFGVGDMHEVDTSTGQILTSVAPTLDLNGSGFVLPIDKCLGLATDPTTGQMYAIYRDFDSYRFLVEIDPVTAIASVVAEFTLSGSSYYYVNHIAFDSTGQMKAMESRTNGFRIFDVDKTTAIINPVHLCTLDDSVDDFFGGMALNYDDEEVYILHNYNPFYDLIKVDFNQADCVGTTTTLSGFAGEEYPQDMTYDTNTSKFIARDDYAPPLDLLTFGTDGVTTNLGTENNYDMRGLAFTLVLDDKPVITLLGGGDPLFVVGGTYVEAGATCQDTESGNLDDRVVVGGDVVNTAVAGTYIVTYDCEDDFPQSSLEVRTVTVEENVPVDFTDKLWACDSPHDEGGQIHLIDQTDGSTILSKGLDINPNTVAGSVGQLQGHHQIFNTTAGIGGTWNDGCTWLTVDPTDGQMYGILEDNLSERYLVSIDPEAGTGQAIGWAERTDAFANGWRMYVNMIAIDGDGTAYVTAGQASDWYPSEINTIDLATGIIDEGAVYPAINLSVCDTNTSVSPIFSDDFNYLTYNKNDGKMYMMNGASASDHHIWEFDKTAPDCVGSNTVTMFSGATTPPSEISGVHYNYMMGFTYDDKIGEFFVWDDDSTPQRFRSLTTGGSDTLIADKTGYATQFDQYRGIAMTLIDQERPELTIVGDETPTLQVGDNYLEEGAICLDEEDGNITANVVVGGDAVNTFVAGTYYVTYTCTDSFPESASQLYRVVTVSADVTPPEVTVTGDSFQEIAVGGTYTELGATAFDTDDGDITGDVVIGGDVVDTSTAGIYFVQYEVTDSGGNTDTGIRTILVAEAGGGSGSGGQSGGTVDNPIGDGDTLNQEGTGSQTGSGSGSSSGSATPSVDDLSEEQLEDLLSQLAPSQETTIVTEIFQTFFEFRVLDKTHEDLPLNSFLSDQSLGIQWTTGDDIIVSSIRPAMSPFDFIFEEVPVIKVGSGSALSENSVIYNLDVPDTECTVDFAFDCVEKIRYSVPVTVNAIINGTDVEATGTILVDLTEDQINPIILILLGTIAIPIIAGVVHHARGGSNPSQVKDLLH